MVNMVTMQEYARLVRANAFDTCTLLLAMLVVPQGAIPIRTL
jgi:hypothetical protein